MHEEYDEYNPKMGIWWFIGLMFIAYGVIIFATGIYYWFNPASAHALNHYHPAIWWGALLFIVGIIFYKIDRYLMRQAKQEHRQHESG